MPQRVATRIMAGREFLTSENVVLVVLAAVSFAGHMLFAGNYGYFRDELYYLADGKHLAAGYVDQPFLIGLLAALMQLLFRDNLFAIHLVSALACACLIVVTGLMARELGGGRYAQALAAVATMFAPVFMATGSIFSMDVLDELCWAVAGYTVIRLIARQQPRLWLVFGLVAGIALTAKLTMLFFGFALTLALLLTPTRSYFRSRWLWFGGLLALAFLIPYGVWNAVNGWPTWEFWHHYGGVGNSPLSFFINQILLVNPITLPLAITGFVFYFRRDGQPFRVLGWTVVILALVFALGTFKPYFLPPAYPLLFAPGAVVVERSVHWQVFGRRLEVVYPAAITLLGLLLAPLTMPILPPATFVRDYGFLTGVGNGGAGQQTAGAFPQYLGDRFGWDTLTQDVAKVYASLPASQQSEACILAENYGEASALALLGPKYHLPPVISGHNNYYFWGPGACTGEVLITVGYEQGQLTASFGSVRLGLTHTCAYCMTQEDNLPLYICTSPHGFTVGAAWQRLK